MTKEAYGGLARGLNRPNPRIMRAALPTLFPRPRELSLRGGFLPVPAPTHPLAQFLASLPQTIADAQGALDAAANGACRCERAPSYLHPSPSR